MYAPPREQWQEPHPTRSHPHHHHLPVDNSSSLSYAPSASKFPSYSSFTTCSSTSASDLPPLPPPSAESFPHHTVASPVDFELPDDPDFPALFESLTSALDRQSSDLALLYSQQPQQPQMSSLPPSHPAALYSYLPPPPSQSPLPHLPLFAKREEDDGQRSFHDSASHVSYQPLPPPSYSVARSHPSSSPFTQPAFLAPTAPPATGPYQPTVPSATSCPWLFSAAIAATAGGSLPHALSSPSSSPPMAAHSALTSPTVGAVVIPSHTSTSTTISSPSSPSSFRVSPPSPHSSSASSKDSPAVPFKRPALSSNPILDRRLKHREIDAVRKQKETALLRELEQLTLTEEERKERETCHVKEEAGVVDPKAKKKRRKRVREGEEEKRKEKLAVLQSSVRRIQELEARCAELTQRVGPEQEESMTRWGDFLQLVANRHAMADAAAPSPLARLPPSACECLAYLTHHHALYTSSFIRTPLCFALAEVSTGFILDANSNFLAFSGWNKGDILQHTFTKPFVHPSLGLPPATRVSPLVRGGRSGRRWLEDSWELPQSPRSRQAKGLLLSGAVASIHESWRSRFADGRVYEFFAMSWVSRWEDRWVGGQLEGGKGGRGGRGGSCVRVPVELSMMFEGREDALVQEIPRLGLDDDEDDAREEPYN